MRFAGFKDNLSQKDETWVEFWTLDVGMQAYVMQLFSKQKQPNLKLKTWLKQLLGSLSITFALPAYHVMSIIGLYEKATCQD